MLDLILMSTVLHRSSLSICDKSHIPGTPFNQVELVAFVFTTDDDV